MICSEKGDEARSWKRLERKYRVRKTECVRSNVIDREKERDKYRKTRMREREEKSDKK